MKQILTLFTTILLSASLCTAQADEASFKKAQAKKLNAFATKAMKKGFPQRAKLVFLMVLSVYDPDSAVAHEALGRTKSGTAWAPTPGFRFPRNDKPDPSAAKSLKREFEKLAEQLVRAHKTQAKKALKGGRTDLVDWHYRTILRFAPTDKEAETFLKYGPVRDGLSGTNIEKDLYDRGVKIEDIVKAEGAKDYPVEALPDSDRHPVLEKAQVEYKSVKTEHFTIRGDFDVEILKQAGVWAERAFRVIAVAYEGHERMFLSDPSKWRVTQFSFFKSRDTYKQIVNANADKVKDKKQLEFLLEHTGATAIGNLRISSAAGTQRINDGAIRSVAHSYSVFSSAALMEGIGHTFVGLMLHNNRSFLVDLKKQLGTQTEEEEIDQFNPDMDLWEDLALEQAWSKTNYPAVGLPLIQASEFNDEARIKSWSFCHYVMLRNPTLLRQIDMCSQFKNVIDIEKNFTKAAGVSLATLEKEWKDFFTGATPVLRAIKARKDPLTAVSTDVNKWLKAINEVREKTFYATPLNWSSNFSGRCRDHAEYLRENKLAGPDHEQQQDPSLPRSTHPGRMFAQMAMVHTKAKNPKKVIEEWMRYPGYRDVFMVNTLKTIGVYAEKGIVVLNVVQGLVKPRTKRFSMYPKSGMTRIPNQVEVDDLGPEMKQILAREGHADKKVLGFPISGHFGNSGFLPLREHVECKVTVNDRTDAKGFIHFGNDGNHRRTSSPGMMVFFPLEPIRKGAKVRVVWTFKNGRRLEQFDSTFYH